MSSRIQTLPHGTAQPRESEELRAHLLGILAKSPLQLLLLFSICKMVGNGESRKQAAQVLYSQESPPAASFLLPLYATLHAATKHPVGTVR